MADKKTGDVVLVSVHPQFADAIADGRKKFEFRKVRFQRDVKLVVIYATAPVSAVVAVIEVAAIHQDTPFNIWKKCASDGGIRADWYFRYYDGCDSAIAIEISKVLKLDSPLRLDRFSPTIKAPQSFMYLPIEASRWAASVLASAITEASGTVCTGECRDSATKPTTCGMSASDAICLTTI